MASEIDQSPETATRVRRRRADAERSVAAILDAAVQVLGERPEASMEEIAAAAGVTRQTVYAHFASRSALLDAVIDHLSELTADLLGPELDMLAPIDALRSFLDRSWESLERQPALLTLAPTVPSTPEADRERHQPIAKPLERIVRRGQRRGDIDRSLSASWLVTALIALSHAAAEEVRAGRMRPAAARAAVETSLLRLCGR